MTIGSNSAAELRALIERIENIEEQKRALSEDLKEVYAEARITGFDVKALRRIVAERKLDIEERRERRDLHELYAEKVNLYGDAEGLV